MRPLAYAAVGLLASFLVTACENTSNVDDTGKAGSKVKVENPTGDCVAFDSGARPGYHAPGDTTWLPDCENPLRREYWRVFATTPETAYIMPRPDGDPGLEAACTNEEHPLYTVVQYYALCQPASSAEAVARINSIYPKDALAVTHELHSRLRFVANEAGIAPSPIPSDILDACALHSNDDEPELAAICEREADRLGSGNDIGFAYEGPGAVALAKRLNELYGIPLD